VTTHEGNSESRAGGKYDPKTRADCGTWGGGAGDVPQALHAHKEAAETRWAVACRVVAHHGIRGAVLLLQRVVAPAPKAAARTPFAGLSLGHVAPALGRLILGNGPG